MRGAASALFGRRARLRWVHLVLGGALLMPYMLVAAVAVGPLFPGEPLLFGSVPFLFACFAVAVPLAALTAAAFPLARPLAVGLVRALCGVQGEVAGEGLAEGAARSWSARGRASAWFALHLGVGAVLSGAMLATPPFAVVLVVLPLFPALRDSRLSIPQLLVDSWGLALAPVAGLALLLALAGYAAGAAAVLARCAPRLLGPTPADRLAAAEARAADLAVRNRLARELHDSVGHALSAVTLQAGAARRVLDSDPDFVREALAAIEDTTRRTVGELDAVLGLLRTGDDAAAAPAPTLADDLDGLLSRTRAAGLTVAAEVDGDLAALPALVGREGYRIVQEGLSNALRYANGAPVRLQLAVTDEELTLVLTNPVPSDTAPSDTAPRTGGGRGLRGIEERAGLLGGTAHAGAADGVWTLHVRLPVEARS
ncbi:sensor histidine kinase [Streptomyces cavernicola]|uniref:histidine kinase n=1 Tax=Streptomyces cavernicola TaxID=3043613 RepID=A0ABT6SC66_9ACTN|nr:histidine kinase [Streptomyces sp. B-S-A6]MDI3404876.1 histidine kinase [Streptomyces sp. B-S-A6]